MHSCGLNVSGTQAQKIEFVACKMSYGPDNTQLIETCYGPDNTQLVGTLIISHF